MESFKKYSDIKDKSGNWFEYGKLREKDTEDAEKELLRKLYVEEKNRRIRFFYTFSVLCLVGLSIFSMYNSEMAFSKPLIFFSFCSIMILAFFSYLRPTSNQNINQTPLSNDLKLEMMLIAAKNRQYRTENIEWRKKFDEILQRLREGAGAGNFISDKDKELIFNKIQEKLESEALENFQSKLISQVEERIRYNSHENTFRQITLRLEDEVQSLSRRGNVNLFLGMVTTIVGIYILVDSFRFIPNTLEMIHLVSYFIPKLSLVILIEIFAYFFLKLYKQSLSEIKFFQNEITNIESKYLGLQLALTSGIDSAVVKIIDSLATTERNFLLEKGQSTVELEHSKQDSKHSLELMGILNSLINKIK